MENKINYFEKKKVDVDSIKEDYKEFIKNNKSLSATQQTFRSENVFTEEINKNALSSNDDKIMWSIGSIETQAYKTSKDLVRD